MHLHYWAKLLLLSYCTLFCQLVFARPANDLSLLNFKRHHERFFSITFCDTVKLDFFTRFHFTWKGGVKLQRSIGNRGILDRQHQFLGTHSWRHRHELSFESGDAVYTARECGILHIVLEIGDSALAGKLGLDALPERQHRIGFGRGLFGVLPLLKDVGLTQNLKIR